VMSGLLARSLGMVASLRQQGSRHRHRKEGVSGLRGIHELKIVLRGGPGRITGHNKHKSSAHVLLDEDKQPCSEW
jgi:hypothetical protein